MQIAQYYDRVDQLKESIKAVKADALYLNDENSLKKLEDLERYIEDEKFNLVVVGEFSRGKSTFVNAIMGKRLLPSSKNPTTATLNIVENGGEEPVFTIHYHDGGSKMVDEAGFKSIVAAELISNSQKDQIEYVKKVQEIQAIRNIHISVANQLGENGITIIDTPGVNDLDTRREQITYDFIPKADAAIVLLAAIPLLAASEIKFIKERILKNDISKLFVIINFKDRLTNGEECQRVLDKAKEMLADVVAGEHIFLLSAKDALTYKRKQNGEVLKSRVKVPETLEQTGFADMEQALYEFLATERGNIKLERFKSIFHSIIRDLLDNALAERMQNMHLSREELGQKIDRIRPMIHQNKTRCGRELEALKRTLLKEQAAFEKEYRQSLTAVAYKAKGAVEVYAGAEPNELFEQISDATALLQEDMQVHFPQRIQETVNRHVTDALHRIGEDFSAVGVQLNMFENMGSAGNMISVENVQNLDVSETEQIDGVAALSLGLMVGGFLLGCAIGAAAIPVMYIGGKLMDSYLANQGDTGGSDGNQTATVTNASVCRAFMSEVNKNYFEPIDDKVKEFRNDYERQITEIVENIEKECNVRLEQKISQMEAELEEKRRETLSIEKEMESVGEMKRSLEKILSM